MKRRKGGGRKGGKDGVREGEMNMEGWVGGGRREGVGKGRLGREIRTGGRERAKAGGEEEGGRGR